MNDPFGVQANINCLTGKGDCVEAIVSDVLWLISVGWGRAAAKAAAAEAAATGRSASRTLASLDGSGPAKGILEVSDRVKSVGAVKNFSPKGERDFVFDPTTGRFATGADQGVGGHDFLGSAVGADESTVVSLLVV